MLVLPLLLCGASVAGCACDVVGCPPGGMPQENGTEVHEKEGRTGERTGNLIPSTHEADSAFDPAIVRTGGESLAYWSGIIDSSMASDQMRIMAIQIVCDYMAERASWSVIDVTPPEDVHRDRIRLVASGECGAWCATLAPSVAKGLKSDSAAVRREAALWLSCIGPLAYSALESIRSAVQDDDAYVRCWCARGLFTVACESMMSVEVSISLLEHSDRNVVMNAIGNLEIIGAAAYRSRPFLERLLLSGDDQVIEYAQRVVLKLGSVGGR